MMIDIHSHILPGMDDGSKRMEDTIYMLKMAAASGTDTIIATPHCNLEGIYDNYYGDTFQEHFYCLEKEIRRHQLPIKIIPGMEVFGTEEVPELLLQGKLITLNHSRYLLMEFSFKEDPALNEFLIKEIVKLGFCPIIAHPERYPYVQKEPDMVDDWIDMGCFLQMNKGSILGRFGSDIQFTSLELLSQNRISFIGSDAHGTRSRTTDLSEVYHFVCNYYSVEYADTLLRENPKRVIEDKELVNLSSIYNKRELYYE